MIRRFLGILLAAAMAHVAVAGSDSACATHDRHMSQHQAPESGAGPHHQHGEQAEQEQCDAPANSDCCEAMTTCSANAELAGVVVSEAPLGHGSTLAAHVVGGPLGRLVAPDPPPPKA